MATPPKVRIRQMPTRQKTLKHSERLISLYKAASLLFQQLQREQIL